MEAAIPHPPLRVGANSSLRNDRFSEAAAPTYVCTYVYMHVHVYSVIHPFTERGLQVPRAPKRARMFFFDLHNLSPFGILYLSDPTFSSLELSYRPISIQFPLIVIWVKMHWLELIGKYTGRPSLKICVA